MITKMKEIVREKLTEKAFRSI